VWQNKLPTFKNVKNSVVTLKPSTHSKRKIMTGYNTAGKLQSELD